jgi:hypothetical protein
MDISSFFESKRISFSCWYIINILQGQLSSYYVKALLKT